MKRGKSAQAQIITTILIILLVLAAIVIVWNVISRTIEKTSEQVSTKPLNIKLDIKQVQAGSGGGIDVQVQRSSGTGNLTELKFILEDSSEQTYIETITTNLPTELETKSYNIFSLLGIGINVKKISVIPVVDDKFGIQNEKKVDITIFIMPELVSWWKFDSDTGFNDSMGRNNGTAQGDAHIENNVLVLDGVDGNYVDTASFSIAPSPGKSGCAWINPSAHTNNNAGVFRHRYISSIRINTEGKIADRLSNSTGDDSSSYFSNTNILTNWSFVCVIWESPGIGKNLLLTYYLNGVEDGSHVTNIVDENGFAGSSISSTLRIGSDEDYYLRIFNGSIDNVMIFNKSLSLSEINGIFNNQKQGKI